MRPCTVQSTRPRSGRCFGCHTTAANIGDKFDEKNLMLGVTCEACHGAGAKHVATAEAARIAGMPEPPEETFLTPAQLTPVDAVDFCGACHGTFWDVKLSDAKGVSTVKSQPYRLEGSKCWGTGDSRLTCTACHNPHEPVQTDPTAYDGACLACHVSSNGKKDCCSLRCSLPGERLELRLLPHAQGVCSGDAL